MPALTHQIDDRSVLLALLEITNLESRNLGSAKVAPQHECQDGLISQTFQRLHVRRLATVSLLIHRQPIAQAHTQNCPRRGDLSKLDLTTPSPYAVLPKPLCGARRNRPAQFLAVLPGSRMTYSITRN
jgi:hypothetical protein